ncbi:hypothetical protein [Dialister sp.]|nr:hypothetical protein [Dialister sp.]MEE3452302.1 hypothetical protein [Dialister sp.]
MEKIQITMNKLRMERLSQQAAGIGYYQATESRKNDRIDQLYKEEYS